jgi:hypothetical protein
MVFGLVRLVGKSDTINFYSKNEGIELGTNESMKFVVDYDDSDFFNTLPINFQPVLYNLFLNGTLVYFPFEEDFNEVLKNKSYFINKEFEIEIPPEFRIAFNVDGKTVEIYPKN